MPGIPNLVVVNLWQIVGRVQPERLHVEAPYGAEERVGCDHAVALSEDQPSSGIGQILQGVEYVDRRALSCLRLPLHPQ